MLGVCKVKSFILSISHRQLSCVARSSPVGIDFRSSTIVENVDLIRSHLEARRSGKHSLDTVDAIIDLEKSRRDLSLSLKEKHAEKKRIGNEYFKASKIDDGNKCKEIKLLGESIRASLHETEVALHDTEHKISKLYNSLPNLLHDDVPDGADETGNIVLSTYAADLRKLAVAGDGECKYHWHDDIMRKNGWCDFEAAGRMSGTRFNVLHGNISRFERELSRYFVDFHTSLKETRDGPGSGYTEVSVPYIVARDTLEGTGHLPKFEDDLFHLGTFNLLKGQDAFLIPTAEVPVSSMFREQIIDANDLPVNYVCQSPSFRAEAGAYGVDTRGILRQHHFNKVELVKVTSPEDSHEQHLQMVNDVELLIQSLELPYRKVLLCSGDTGFSASMCYDIEVWFPGQQRYREVASISNCTDFQSKRMKFIATRNAFNISRGDRRSKSIHPHTINGSGIAVGRALAAILENYQRSDGSVEIPKVLQPYLPVDWKGVIPPSRMIKKKTNLIWDFDNVGNK